MFNRLRIRYRSIVLTLFIMLLLGGILLFAPGSTPAAHAQASGLTLELKAPAYVEPGRYINYTLEVKNPTSLQYNNVYVYDYVPANVDYVSGGTLLYTTSGSAYIDFHIPDIAPGETKSLTWRGLINDSLLGRATITNSIYDFYYGAGTKLSGDITSTIYDLSITLVAPTYVQQGQTITYEFKVENVGNTTFPELWLYDYIPANVTYVSGGFLSQNGLYVDLNLPSIPAHSVQTVSWTGTVSSTIPVGTIIENNSFGNYQFSGLALKSGGSSTLVEIPPTESWIYKNGNTDFDAKVHGYQFQNYGASPRNVDDFSKSDVFELVGPAACIAGTGTSAQDCVLKAGAQAWLQKAIASPDGGHCDGFAATSLRLFNSMPYNQYSTPGTFQPGAVNTIDLALPGQPIEHYIHRYFMTQNFIWNGHVTGTPSHLVEVLKSDFQSASPVGYTVSVFITDNLDEFNDDDWRAGHSITAVGVEKVTDSEYRILVYDNNFPKQRQYIVVDIVNNTWTYKTAATPGANEEIYQGTAVSGNLRLVPLTLRDNAPGQYYACYFCNDSSTSAVNSNKSEISAPGMVSGNFEVNFTGEGAIMIVNDEGERFGEDHETGEFFTEIPGAEMQHFMGGLGQDVPASITIPFEEHDDTFYTVFVHGTTVENPTNGTLSIHGPGIALGVSDIHLDADNVFKFTFSPDGDHISFTATEDLEAPEIYIAHDPIHDGDPSVIFDIEGVVLLADEKVMLDLDPALEQIHFNHTGPEEENFVVDMKLIWPDGHVEDYAETIHMPASAHSAFIDFGAWDGLEHPPIYIDDVLQNPSINHRLKLEDVVGTYDPAPQTNAPAGVYTIEATFSNVTEISLEDVYFTVANLGLGDVLLNADPGSAGTRVSVPADVLGDDGILHTFDSFTFTFEVGLADTNFGDLTVDANGVPHDWIHPDPAPSYDANNASFVFDGGEALPNQLGVMLADVEELLADGQLPQNTALRLLQNLDRAAQLLAQGQDEHRIIRELNMFINRVQSGTNLPAETKALLIAQAEFVIYQLYD